MNKFYILPSLALVSLGFFAFQQATSPGNGVVEKFKKEHLQSSGGQSGLTGAPGESNCTQCHSGTVLSGTGQNIVTFLSGVTPVTSYTPGNTYTISLSLTSNPGKRGFSAVALTPSNTNAGSSIGAGIGGTQNFTSAGRQYVSHTTTSSTATTPFAWSWVAPATNVGNVTFYVASNAANDNNLSSGDMIYLSQHIFTPASGAGIEETSNEANFEAGYNMATNKLVVNFNYLGIGEMHLNLVDLNGRSVFTYDLGQSEIGENKETIALPSSLQEGMYVVHFFVGNKAMSANILVKK